MATPNGRPIYQPNPESNNHRIVFSSKPLRFLSAAIVAALCGCETYPAKSQFPLAIRPQFERETQPNYDDKRVPLHAYEVRDANGGAEGGSTVIISIRMESRSSTGFYAFNC